MPPKRKVDTDDRILLGRPGNNLKMGIVGLPNVGKSSLFNAVTNSSVPSENFPFCTIDPSEARVAVLDPRFDWLVEQYKPSSKINAYLNCIDIAGLVKGAAEGQGLGNAFLSNIKAVDGIFQVVRCFDDPDIAHVEGDVDPIRDLEIIHNELRLKDIEFVKKHYETAAKGLSRTTSAASAADKAKRAELEILQKILKTLEDKKDIRTGNWGPKEVEVINPLFLLTAKPVVYLANCSAKDYVRKKNKWLAKVKTWIDEANPGSPNVLIPFSGIMESELSMRETQEDKDAYLKSLQTQYESPAPVTTVLNKIVTTGYSALNLIYFFTAGPDEVRAWTIRIKTKAPQAAGVIHTDFEKAFVMAEIMKFDDLKEYKNEAGVKAAGKYLSKGRDYEVQDGDIIYFKIGQVTAPKKK